MKVQVLEEALDDLADGYRFYERQSEGLGTYFLDSLWSDVDSLCVYAGIHPVWLGYHRLLSKRFPSPYTTVSRTTWRASAPSWIAGGIPLGFATA